MSSKSITCSLDETILNDTIEFLLICRFKTMSGEMLNISIFALLCRLGKHVLTMSQNRKFSAQGTFKSDSSFILTLPQDSLNVKISMKSPCIRGKLFFCRIAA